jgi:ParB-like chromosome segregation protein Spo0J
LYEPLIVQPFKQKKGYFQIINGYHRAKALAKLGHKTAVCVVWDVDAIQTGVFLMTLNRLSGKDDLNKRTNLLKYLSGEIKPDKLSKVLLQTETQIKRLLNLKIKVGEYGKDGKHTLNPMVFSVTDEQKGKIEKAISGLSEQVKEEKTKAAKRAAALVVLAEHYLNRNVN